jgi:hypothetical protein
MSISQRKINTSTEIINRPPLDRVMDLAAILEDIIWSFIDKNFPEAHVRSRYKDNIDYANQMVFSMPNYNTRG